MKSLGDDAPPGIRVAVWYASGTGWAGESRHAAVPGQSCVQSVGSGGPEVFTLQQHLPAAPARGRVVCDFDSPEGPR